MNKILEKYNIKAKKSLGQNFLLDEKILNNIVNTLDIKWKSIIEVGTGYGALTEKLISKKVKNLTLIELDKDMVNILEDRKENDFDLTWINLEIINKDILDFQSDFIDYSLIANIPYYITSPILRHFLYSQKYAPKNMLILMQKDVWDKILLWQSGNSSNNKKIKTSVLSLFISKKSDVKEVCFVWKECFHPATKVESSVISFSLHSKYSDLEDDFFLEIIKKWFSSPRKKLIKNLESVYKKDKLNEIFSSLSISDNSRWENLSIDKWYDLAKKLSNIYSIKK